MSRTIQDIFDELLREVSKFADSKDYIHLLASHRNFNPARNQLIFSKFPEMITQRKLILDKIRPELSVLALKSVAFSDHVGHEFNLSWYQYALYTKDTALQIYLENCINQLKDLEVRNVAFSELKKQYNEFREQGIPFRFKNHTKTSKGVSLKALIHAYESYLDHPDDSFLVHVVGQLQKQLLPKHMLMEMCHPRGFNPKPRGSSLKDVETVRAKVWIQEFYPGDPPGHCLSSILHKDTKGSGQYFPVELGIQHVLVRGSEAGKHPIAIDHLYQDGRHRHEGFYTRAWDGYVNVDSLKEDLTHFKALEAMRTQELNEVLNRLERLEKGYDEGLSSSCKIC